jgi:hypothetical protein
MFSIGNSITTSAPVTCSGQPRDGSDGALAELADLRDLGRVPLTDPVALPRNGDERPAGLFAGESGCGPSGVDGLDVVGAAEASGVTHVEVLE